MINIISQSTSPWRRGEQIDGHVVRREGSSRAAASVHGGGLLSRRAGRSPAGTTASRPVCKPSQSLESSKCRIRLDGLRNGRIHAKKKAWLLETLSSWSIFHLLSLNYFLSVRVYRYHRSFPECSVVQYFKIPRFP